MFNILDVENQIKPIESEDIAVGFLHLESDYWLLSKPVVRNEYHIKLLH